MPAQTFLRPFTHLDYIDEYLDLILNKYGVIRPNYFCTYFKFDFDNSILDDREHIESGYYHLAGNLSGVKWKKIQLLPVWLVENHGPITKTMREDGTVSEYRTSIVLPDYFGLRPTPNDFVYMFNSVSNTHDENEPLYQVISISESYSGKRKIYKIDMKNNFRKLLDIDVTKHISSDWIYVNHLRKIMNLDVGRRLIKTLSFSYDMFSDIQNGKNINYDTSMDVYNARYSVEV